MANAQRSRFPDDAADSPEGCPLQWVVRAAQRLGQPIGVVEQFPRSRRGAARTPYRSAAGRRPVRLHRLVRCHFHLPPLQGYPAHVADSHHDETANPKPSPERERL